MKKEYVEKIENFKCLFIRIAKDNGLKLAFSMEEEDPMMLITVESLRTGDILQVYRHKNRFYTGAICVYPIEFIMEDIHYWKNHLGE